MVIRKVAPNSPLQRDLLRQAFVRANPHAFRRNNPNWMYAGVVLKVPDIDDLRRVIFKDATGSLKKNVSDEKAGWVGSLDMDLAAPGGVGSNRVAPGLHHTLRLVIADEADAAPVLRAHPEVFFLTKTQSKGSR